jgi:cytosine/adenosine deaminase-related metal-dependent hydrolase
MAPTRERTLIRNATIVTVDARDTVHQSGSILVDDGRIAAVGNVPETEAARCDRVIDGTGRLVVPGFVNGHLHSPMNITKATIERLSHPALMWLNQADTAHRTPREIYVSALLGCAEMLLTGTTSVLDNFPEQVFELTDVEPAIHAYRDSGMRAVVALRIFDEEYSDIFPADGAVPADLAADLRRLSPLRPRPASELLALCDESIRRWNGLDGRVRVFPAPSNPSRCTDALLTGCQALAERYDVGIHMHLLETQIQSVIAQRRYGCTMVRHLDDLGVLSSRLSCAHSIWLDDDDIARMADRRAVAVHNPESNLKVGTGIARIPAMLARGVPIALGTDGTSSNDNLILQNAMQIATLLHRTSEPRERWVSARDALRMATRGGAQAMLLPEAIGAIEVGKRADLVLYDLTAPWWTPLNDPVQQLVYGENGSSVHTVLVDGRVVVDARRITTFDAGAVVAEARPMLAAIRARNRDLHDVARRMADVVS